MRIPKLYSGSYWHQDCDPIGTIIGADSLKVDNALADAMDEEQERCEDVPEDEQDEINLRYSGVFPVSFSELKELFRQWKRFGESFRIEDLRQNGIEHF